MAKRARRKRIMPGELFYFPRDSILYAINGQGIFTLKKKRRNK